MYNELVYGINEIVCEANKDRYKIIDKITENYKTIFINHLKNIDSLPKLQIFVFKKLEKLVETYQIECIVIHSLDSFLFFVENLKEERKRLLKIINRIKTIIKIYFVKVIITTTINNYTYKVEFNNYLGFEWNYAVNCKFQCKRRLFTKRGECVEIKEFEGEKIIAMFYKIYK